MGVTLSGVTARAEGVDPDSVGPRVRRIVGERALQIIAKATRAEVFRLAEIRAAGWKRPPLPPGAPAIAGYQIEGKAHPLSPAIIDAFRTTLFDTQTYTDSDLPPNVGSAKMCGGFRPGVAVRFWSSIDRKAAHADVLLCFFCADIAIVDDRADVPLSTHDMSTGEIPLLRLAAAALPDDATLAGELSSRQADHLRERLFLWAFPPRAQLELVALRGDPDEGNERSIALLRKELPGAKLFVTAARAFGARSDSWTASDAATGVVVRAVRQLSSAELAAGMTELGADQVALAGAAELFARCKLEQKAPPAALVPWTLAITEAAIVRMPFASRTGLLKRLAKLPDGRGRPLLVRIASGDLAAAPRPPDFMDPVSARACAFMALAEVSPEDARSLARTWRPSPGEDQAAAKAVLFRTQESATLDPSVFDGRSHEVMRFAIDSIGARPTRASVDVLVSHAIGHKLSFIADLAEARFSKLTGMALPPSANDDDQAPRTALIRAWWREHGASWQPPTAPRP